MKDVLNKLGWKHIEFSSRFQGCCPIHGGDNETALSICKKTGLWHCFTHQCQKKHGAQFHCFIKAYIESNAGELINIDDIESWLKENSGVFNAQNIDIKKIKEPRVICSREAVLERLEIPSTYYIKRGFSKEILERHDVGWAGKKSTYMYNRHVIPIYNHYYTGVIGCSGRLETRDKTKRWRHSKGLERDLSLYNSWFAESYVKNSDSIYITEGPAKVWRLEEAGFMNSVAIMGTAFTLSQKKILSRMGPKNIYIIMDNDKAGKDAATIIHESLKDLYNVKILNSPFGDLDETPIEKVRKFINESTSNRN